MITDIIDITFLLILYSSNLDISKTTHMLLTFSNEAQDCFRHRSFSDLVQNPAEPLPEAVDVAFIFWRFAISIVVCEPDEIHMSPRSRCPVVYGRPSSEKITMHDSFVK